MIHIRCLVALSGCLLGACPDRPITKVDPSPQAVEEKLINVNATVAVDMLFVIDASLSMQDEQESLKANFPAFIAPIQALTPNMPDVHIGVVTPNMGSGSAPYCNDNEGGALRTGSSVSGTFISDVAGPAGRVTNYSGTLTDAFRQLATVGTDGCGLEAHLGAMRAALDNPANNGFLRDDAHLAIIFVQDEDDCSVDDNAFYGSPWSINGDPFINFRCFAEGVVCEGAPGDALAHGPRSRCEANPASDLMPEIQEFVDAVQAQKAGTNGRILAASIMGPREPVVVGQRGDHTDTLSSCPSSNAEAYPGIRIAQFVEALGGSTYSICDADLGGALRDIAKELVVTLGTPCVEGNLQDADPTTEAIEPTCVFADVQDPYGANPVETSLPACNANASNTPCWRMLEDASLCSAFPSQLVIDVVRSAPPPENTYLRGECVVEPS